MRVSTLNTFTCEQQQALLAALLLIQAHSEVACTSACCKILPGRIELASQHSNHALQGHKGALSAPECCEVMKRSFSTCVIECHDEVWLSCSLEMWPAREMPWELQKVIVLSCGPHSSGSRICLRVRHINQGTKAEQRTLCVAQLSNSHMKYIE